MADDPLPTPPPEGTSPPAVAPVVPPPEAPPAPPAEGTPPAAPAAAAPTIPESVFNRIDRLTKDKKEAEELAARRAAALQAAGIDPVTLQPLAQPPAEGTPPAARPATGGDSLPAAEIERRAQELLQERTFTEQCNKIASDGEAAHQDFGMKMGQLNALGVMSPQMITAALEIGDSHEILYALASDLNEAARIGGLAPAQQAVALVKFNEKRKAEAAKHVSKAPAPPPVQVGGGTPLSNDTPSPEDKSDDWFRKREKQIGIASGNYH